MENNRKVVVGQIRSVSAPSRDHGWMYTILAVQEGGADTLWITGESAGERDWFCTEEIQEDWVIM